MYQISMPFLMMVKDISPPLVVVLICSSWFNFQKRMVRNGIEIIFFFLYSYFFFFFFCCICGEGVWSTWGGCKDVSLGGYLQGGGEGNGASLLGMGVDVIRGARIVLYNATIITTNETNHKDLFWVKKENEIHFFHFLILCFPQNRH